MSFVSVPFLLLFLVVYAGRRTVGKLSGALPYLLMLLAADMVFYAWHVPSYLLIILTSTVVDWIAGRSLERETRPGRRKAILAASIVTNLSLLGYFKYTNFFLGEIEQLAGSLGLPLQLGQLDLILPMGISFYTFQSMSYTIDVYRGTLAPLRSFWRFLLFVSFFPQLVAGPIVRAKDFLYQLDRNRRLHLGVALEGCWLVIRGLFLKTVVADNLGPVVDHWWQASAEPGANASIARAVILLFSFQIFCDFAGYSSIARGLAYLLGFRLPTNFEAPYIAGTFRNFWTRWHISLSSWFRDYLYIPLGGSRYGWKRTAIAILLTFVISGLWHGPARTFLLWGLLHGLALLLERAVGMSGRIERPAWLRLSWFFFVQLLVLAAWTFFRADSVPQALGILSNASSLRVDSLASFPWLACGALLLGPVAVHLRTLLCERGLTPAMGRIERALLAAVMLYAAATAHGVNNAFIYFQF